MAEASISVAPDQFCCPVCLEQLKEPVALPCGHTFCMVCITDCWNQDDEKGVCSCPQCRQAFAPRPVLNKNTILAEMVEKLRKSTQQPASPAQCYAGHEDVKCNVCTTGRKRKAVKSCLMCMNSYCQIHLEQHESFFKYKKHHLMEATEQLEEMICETHDRPLEVFCQTDQECICMMCMLDEHKNHKIRTAAAERIDKQRQLEEIHRKYMEDIQQKEQKLQEVRKAIDSHKCSAQTAVEDSERIFTELIHSIESRCSEVTELIRAQEVAAVSQAERLLKRLESGINFLKRKDMTLEELSHTDDHIHFLQSCGHPVLHCVYVPNITVSSQLSYDNIGKSVSLLRGILEDICKEEMERISARASCLLSLDPNTANTHLHLSQRNIVVTYTAHPDRFKINEFGCNDQSWTLRNANLNLLFTHNSLHSKITAPLQSSRIGVYMDHNGGILSFCSVSDTMTLLKKNKTTFSELLYPGFTRLVLRGSSVKLCDLTTQMIQCDLTKSIIISVLYYQC